LYRIRTDHQARDRIAALPDHALESYAQVLGVLELVPWHGRPHNEANPEGAVRQLLFGADNQGIVIYLILDDQLCVDVLEVLWAG
jgi:hypothetical protein